MDFCVTWHTDRHNVKAKRLGISPVVVVMRRWRSTLALERRGFGDATEANLPLHRRSRKFALRVCAHILTMQKVQLHAILGIPPPHTCGVRSLVRRLLQVSPLGGVHLLAIHLRPSLCPRLGAFATRGGSSILLAGVCVIRLLILFATTTSAGDSHGCIVSIRQRQW